MFCVKEDNIDSILRKVYERLLDPSADNFQVTPTKGSNTEVFGALLVLTNPRNRISRSFTRGKLFSALGEFLWYMSGSNEISFIEYYMPGYNEFSDDGKIAKGAYGPRIFGIPSQFQKEENNLSENKENCECSQCFSGNSDQFDRVIDMLIDNPNTRNAVIQIFSNSDVMPKSKDVPCTCTLQFVIRNEKLILYTNMRSNDAFWGLPHDIFSFTMIQEIVSNILEIEIGSYLHSVSSLHLYNDTEKKPDVTMAKQYLDEGFYEHIPMPQMPTRDLKEQISIVLKAEREFRNKNLSYTVHQGLDSYWSDIVNMLKFFGMFKARNVDNSILLKIADDIHNSNFYNTYLFDKTGKLIDLNL